jgi:hypothetical protein
MTMLPQIGNMDVQIGFFFLLFFPILPFCISDTGIGTVAAFAVSKKLDNASLIS